MKQFRVLGFALSSAVLLAVRPVNAAIANPAHAPVVPATADGQDTVKVYLMAIITSSQKGAVDLKADAIEYNQLVAAHGDSTVAAAKAEPAKVADLVLRMRDAYERVDSYGYEYMEGIVAGVPCLTKYDVELDSGVPAKKAQPTDQIADIVIPAGDITIDHEGSLNNFLIEPTVFGTNPRFVDGSAELPGFDKPVNLPKPKLILAEAEYAIGGYARLRHDAEVWTPTQSDYFHVLASMTPTLADYFDDWKESKKYGYAIGGRFVAVSRVSDMRGIMSSTRLTWMAVQQQVKHKDSALATNITRGYDQILQFIDGIDAREQKQPLQVATIDFLGQEAKEKADKLTVQDTQAAAIMGIDVNAK